MILIIKNTLNEIVLTLNDKSTLTNPLFVMKLINKTNNNEKIFYLNNNISNNPKWNHYEIIENAIEDLNLNTISLDGGQYDYIVYETIETDIQNVVFDKIVESGLLECRDVNVQNDIFINPNQNIITFKA